MSQTISAGKTPKIEIESIGGDLSIVVGRRRISSSKPDDEGLRVHRWRKDKSLL